MNKKEKKKFPLWIVGFLCPLAGIIFYFIFRKSKKKESDRILVASIIGFVIFLFVELVINSHNNITKEVTVENWYNDVTTGKQVVTVIGSTTCPHCQEYKPVITALANKNKFNLYFFEIDTLSEEDANTLTTTYELDEYDGHVPYTFIINNNAVVSHAIGFKDRSATIDYLKDTKVIKK